MDLEILRFAQDDIALMENKKAARQLLTLIMESTLNAAPLWSLGA